MNGFSGRWKKEEKRPIWGAEKGVSSSSSLAQDVGQAGNLAYFLDILYVKK